MSRSILRTLVQENRNFLPITKLLHTVKQTDLVAVKQMDAIFRYGMYRQDPPTIKGEAMIGVTIFPPFFVIRLLH